MVKDSDIKGLANYLVNTGLRTISWNHGKVLAVNGKVVMTGGGNYWEEYMNYHISNGSRLDHDIFDSQAKVTGDAAVSAHKWADYFWSYLRQPAQTDDNSTWWGTDLSDFDDSEQQPYWFAMHNDKVPKEVKNPPVKENGKLPDYIRTSPVKRWVQPTKDKPSVFTVAKIGNWHGPAHEIDYPALIVDAARDVLLNALWHAQITADDEDQGLGFRIWFANKALSDYTLSSSLMSSYKINPTVWSSRYTRTWAIAYAQQSVIICQQMLVQNLQADDAAYKGLTTKVNESLKIIDPKQKWDGYIWPMDMLIGIAQAIGAISQSTVKTTDGDWRGVHIVLTTKRAGRRPTWDDRTSILRIKHRIKRIMMGLPFQAGGIGRYKIDKAIEDHLHFKRVMNDDGKVYQHSKVVLVDRKLMYIGSDNAYPCYNEEHGYWVEDQAKIKGWLDGFFTPYWSKCSIPEGEDATLIN